ncbi:MAG TPA: helix-turn-helix transcriptional regulator [Verrucomicrobiae bacterium]|nr:helix-turn-helix transcriptional regulator [Verrucomicrobiae bacterium]
MCCGNITLPDSRPKIFIYRKRAGISQEKLAVKADLSYKYVGEVERGVMNTSLDSLA